jgi:hypothetical protein
LIQNFFGKIFVNKDQKTPKQEVSADVDTYDRGIVPAETAARKEREGDQFKATPNQDKNAAAGTDKEAARPDSINTTEGYTTDKEGLTNNYAIEPEMYVNEPGDMPQEDDQDKAERAEEIAEANEDKEGELTMEKDQRGKGPGMI